MKVRRLRLPQRVVSFIVIFMLAFSALLVSAIAAEISNADYSLYFVPGTNGQDGALYKGDPDGAAGADKLEVEGVSISGNTLTLNNFKFTTTAADGMIIKSGENVKINLLGDSSITAKSTTPSASLPENSNGIKSESELTFGGTGNLTVTAGDNKDSYGIFTEKNVTVSSGQVDFIAGESKEQSGNSYAVRVNKLSVNGTGTISGTAKKAKTSIGVRTYNGLDVKEDGKVIGVSGEASSDSNGVCFDKAMTTITDNGYVSGTSGKASRRSIGIRIYQGATIEDNATVIGKSSDATSDNRGIQVSKGYTQSGGAVEGTGAASQNSTAAGVYLEGTVKVTAGSIKGTGGKTSSNHSYGFYSKNELTVSDGEITGTGGNASNNNSYGVYSEKKLTVSGGEIKGIGGDAPKTSMGSHGILINSDIEITSGTINGISNEGSNATYGVRAKAITASGDSVIYGVAKKAKYDNQGIRGDGIMTLSQSASVTGTAHDTGRDSNGVCVTNGEIKISGDAKLFATAGKSEIRHSYGMRAFKGLTVEGNAQIKAQSSDAQNNSMAIDVEEAYTQNGGTVEGISGSKAGEENTGIYSQKAITLSAGSLKGTSGDSVGESTSKEWISAGVFTLDSINQTGGTIEGIAGKSVTGASRGISVDDNYNISAGKTKGVSGENTTKNGYGIYTTKGKLTVSGTAEVEGIAEKATVDTIGIRLVGGLAISGDGQVKGIAKEAGRDANGVCPEGPKNVGTIVEDNGKLVGIGYDAVGSSFGLRIFDGLTINDNAYVRGESGQASVRTRGVEVIGNYTQSGGTVEGIGGPNTTSTRDSYGIISIAESGRSGGVFTMTGGKAKGISGYETARSGYGVKAVDMQISGDAVLEGETQNSKNNDFGIRTVRLIAKDNAIITGTSNGCAGDGHGIYISDEKDTLDETDIGSYFSGNAKITGICSDSGGASYGFRIRHNLSVKDNVLLTGTSGSAGKEDKSSFGIQAIFKKDTDIKPSVYLENATMIGTSGPATQDSSVGVRIYGPMEVVNGKIIATGNEGLDESSGMRVDEDFIVSGSDTLITATGAKAVVSCGINAMKDMTVSGANVTGEAGYGELTSGGIRTGGALTVDSNTFLKGVSSKGSPAIATGIIAEGLMTVKGGSTVDGDTSGTNASIISGISATNGIALENGAITGKAGTGDDSVGVRTEKAITMTNSTVTGSAASQAKKAIWTELGMKITGAYRLSGTSDTFTNQQEQEVLLSQAGTDPAVIQSGTTFTLKVVNGVDNTATSPYLQDTEIAISAGTAPANQVFDKWVVTSGKGTFANEKAETTTFAIGDVNTVITATYKDITPPDTVPPTGEIKVSTSGWRAFLNTITFNRFFKDTQQVTITAQDNSNENVTIEYYIYRGERPLTAANVSQINIWAPYTNPFSITPDDKLVVYAKLTDSSGNITYISSEGIVLDKQAPTISGAENGQTYNKAVTITAGDANLGSLKINGVEKLESGFSGTEKSITLSTTGTHSIVAMDKAGNAAYLVVKLAIPAGTGTGGSSASADLTTDDGANDEVIKDTDKDKETSDSQPQKQDESSDGAGWPWILGGIALILGGGYILLLGKRREKKE